MSRRLIASVALAGWAAAPWAIAQDAGGGGAAPDGGGGGAKAPPALQLLNQTAAEKGVFAFDYGVPSSPALVLAGQSPDKISTSNALKPFVLQLPTATGTNGQTFGLDVAPAWILDRAPAQTYENYLGGSDGYRIAFRTHFGVAVAQGVDNTDPTKRLPSILALGFSTSLLDGGDPLMAKRLPTDKDAAGAALPATEWAACFAQAAPALQAAANGVDSTDKKRASLDRQYQSLRRESDSLKAEAIALKAEWDQNNATLQDLQAKQQAYAKYANDPKPTIRDLAKLGTESVAGQIATLQARQTAIGQRQEAIKTDLPKVTVDLDAAAKSLDAIPIADAPAMQAAFSKSEAAKLLPACVDRANAAARYAPSLMIGGGALWDGTPGKYSGYQQSGWVGWASYRHALGTPKFKDDGGKLTIDSYWMAGLSVRSSYHELLATGITATPMAKANTVDAWAGLERISADTRLSFQGGYQYRDPIIALPAFERSRFRYYGAITQLVGSKDGGVWVQLGYGNVSEGANDKTVLLSVSFAPPTTGSILGVQ